MQYSDGSVNTTAGSATVTGVGTAWTAAMAGESIMIDSDTFLLPVASVDTAAQTLELAYPYYQSLSGASYAIQVDFTSNLGLPTMRQGDAGGAVIFSEAMRKIDAALQGGFNFVGEVLAQQDAPPGSPSDGDIYLVGDTPSGAWVGYANQYATWSASGSAWSFTAPSTLDFVYDVATSSLLLNTGSAWRSWTITTATMSGGPNSWRFNSSTQKMELWIGDNLKQEFG